MENAANVVEGLGAAQSFAFCEAHAGIVYRFARMVARSDHEAEDLAHDALVRVLRHSQGYDPTRGEVSSWIWKTVINTARDRGRLARRRDALLDRLVNRTMTEVAEDAEELAVAHLSDQALVEATRSLTKRARSVIALRYGADLSFEEIGPHLGMSAAGARMAHRRALAQLRQRLPKEAT